MSGCLPRAAPRLLPKGVVHGGKAHPIDAELILHLGGG